MTSDATSKNPHDPHHAGGSHGERDESVVDRRTGTDRRDVEPVSPTNPNSGSRRASNIADVTVPVVKITRTSAGKADNTGSTDTASPTLAACSQIIRPAGRAVASMPSRSGSRAAISFPRRARRRSRRRSIGAASVASAA